LDVPDPRQKSSEEIVEKNAPLYQLKVEAMGIEPPVWRRLLVRGDMNLGLLHAVIQVAMGWTNSHLHQFTVGDVRYSDPRIDEDMGSDVPPCRDENKTTLIETVPLEGMTFTYEYDFGDSWDHLVTVEEVHRPEAAPKAFVKCLDGGRACPPEDCGGVGGYEDLLEVIRNPHHEDHESMVEWLGGEFDSEAFDITEVNTYLRKLKWPRTTERQLAAVLMTRDGAT
jgi:hypothetical protein